jgi:hypothetical protein
VIDSIVAASDRVYRLVLNVYPRAFLYEYGEEMARTMRDQVRGAWDELRVFGVVALWLRVLVDTPRSALVEHRKQRWRLNPSRDGFGFGLAIAVGFPLALLSYSSPGFWTVVRWVTQTLGLPSWSQATLFRILSSSGFVLAGLGLYGLFQRLDVSSPFSRNFTIGTVWLGVVLGVGNVAGDAIFLPFYEPIPLFYALWLGGLPLVLLASGLAGMGVSAFRKKGFGVLCFVPFAVVASGGMWFLVIATSPRGWFGDALYTSALLIHIALWMILGLMLWGDPQEETESVPAS